ILFSDKSLIYADITAEESATDRSCPSSSSEQCSNIDERNSKWTHNATVALIYEYKNNMKLFQSSTMRKEMVWKIISTNLGQKNCHYTPKQCEFKFKNLKKKYHSKIDNMKATSSGAAAIKFEYFDLFNEIFGHKPNVVPLATASSSRGQGIALNTAEDILQDDDIDIQNKENTQLKKRDVLQVSQSTISRIIFRVSVLIASHVNRYIRMPISEEARVENKRLFKEAGYGDGVIGLPCIDGAIHCTHIRLVHSKFQGIEIYRNRKGYFSLNVQAVVGPRTEFLDIVPEWPGREHDSRIFQNSRIYMRYRQQALDGMLVGDSGDPALPFLLTPIANPITGEEIRFDIL
ncbi:Putative nuclease HARBI1, partial [Trachymyrmex zeteki]